MPKKNFSKVDIIVILSVLLIALIGFFTIKSLQYNGKYVEITKNGKMYQSLPINKDKIIDINGKNVIEIKNKKVYMKSADCENQICVNHKRISLVGETIVCLPNKVVVEIKKGNSNG